MAYFSTDTQGQGAPGPGVGDLAQERRVDADRGMGYGVLCLV